MTWTKAKMWAAAIGGTCTAIVVALGPLQGALADGHIDTGEAAGLIGVAVTLVGTVYAVWRTPNTLVKDQNAGQRP